MDLCRRADAPHSIVIGGTRRRHSPDQALTKATRSRLQPINPQQALYTRPPKTHEIQECSSSAYPKSSRRYSHLDKLQPQAPELGLYIQK